eukprot:GHRQ01039202.1.p1 GENE.GHRQ01039202.1~~GHRQ01039202.1.p1  ORF type:complete len:138 (-),score=25.01 GHRQ01039202.1:7-420(-)
MQPMQYRESPTSCDVWLPQAIPILNDALTALDTIKESDIVCIKKLQNPPSAIKLVMEAVCVVLDVKPVKVRLACSVCLHAHAAILTWRVHTQRARHIAGQRMAAMQHAHSCDVELVCIVIVVYMDPSGQGRERQAHH